MASPSMKLRTKYILFITALHLAALVLSYYVFQENKLVFLAAELVILVSAVLAWQLYRQLLEPLKTLMRGTDAMRDRDFNVKFLPAGQYEMDQLINVYNAMIDKLREERTQQEQQHFFLEKLIHTSPTGIIILDYDQRIQQMNPKAVDMLSVTLPQVLKKEVGQLEHPLLIEIGALASGESKTVNTPLGETYKIRKSHFIDRGFARYFVMLEELTVEILAAEKNAYGKVIRMMAHEVNNTIGPVNSILQSARDVGQPPPVDNALQVAIDRNNGLNLFMRNFADVVRLPPPVCKPVDINQLMRQMAQLLNQRAAARQVQLHLSLTAQPLMIEADAMQMEQVLLNIAKNAIEAVQEKGSIHFITTHTPRQLVVRNTGPGISPAIAPKLFTAFFSTKPDGQGIGLTLIRDILVAHGFGFSLRSDEAGYTDFTIKF